MHIDCAAFGDSRFVTTESSDTMFGTCTAIVVDFLQHVFARGSKGKDA